MINLLISVVLCSISNNILFIDMVTLINNSASFKNFVIKNINKNKNKGSMILKFDSNNSTYVYRSILKQNSGRINNLK